MERLKIILDPAHGSDTPGKQSPDGTHKEYKWSRELCAKLAVALNSFGYDVFYTNAGELECGLTARVAIANKVPGSRKLLISLHNNAAGLGDKWMNASGVGIYTTKGTTKSDKCAEITIQQLRNDFPELKFRMDTTDGDSDIENNFTVLTGSTYMAFLLEWLFQDNKLDLTLIKSKAYNDRLVLSLVRAVNKINMEVI